MGDLVDGARNLILRLEAVLRDMPALTGHEVKHTFEGDVYARALFLPKGSVIVGKLHKLEHIAELTSGRVQVYSEEHGLQDLTAPVQFVSAAGTKRAMFALEDSVWTTYHENTDGTQDLAQLEARLIANDYKELDYELAERRCDGRVHRHEAARRIGCGIEPEHPEPEQPAAGIA